MAALVDGSPRVSPRRRNGKSAAAGVRWTHSQPRKACLLLLRPVRTCVRLHTCTRAHLYTMASVVELFTERIVVAFSRWQAAGKQGREEGDLFNDPTSLPNLRKSENEDDIDDQETSTSDFSIEKRNTRLRHRGIRGRGSGASGSGMLVPRELGRSSSGISRVSSRVSL